MANLHDPNEQAKLRKAIQDAGGIEKALERASRPGPKPLGLNQQRYQPDDVTQIVNRFMGQLTQVNPEATWTHVRGTRIQVNIPGAMGNAMVHLNVNPGTNTLSWRGQFLPGTEPGEEARFARLAKALGDLGNIPHESRLTALTNIFEGQGVSASGTDPLTLQQTGGLPHPSAQVKEATLYRTGLPQLPRSIPRGEKRYWQVLQEQLPPGYLANAAGLSSPGGATAFELGGMLGVAYDPNTNEFVGPDMPSLKRLRLNYNLGSTVTYGVQTTQGVPVAQSPSLITPEGYPGRRPMFDTVIIPNYPQGQAVVEVSEEVARRTILTRQGRRADPVPVQNLNDIELAAPQGQDRPLLGRTLPIYSIRRGEVTPGQEPESQTYSVTLPSGKMTQLQAQAIDLPFRKEAYKYAQSYMSDAPAEVHQALADMGRYSPEKPEFREAQHVVNQWLEKAGQPVFFGGGTGPGEDAMARIISSYTTGTDLQGVKFSGPAKGVGVVVSEFAPMDERLRAFVKGAEVIMPTKEPMKDPAGLVEGMVNTLLMSKEGRGVLSRYGIQPPEPGKQLVWDPTVENDPYVRMTRELMTTEEGQATLQKLGILLKDARVYDVMERSTAEGMIASGAPISVMDPERAKEIFPDFWTHRMRQEGNFVPVEMVTDALRFRRLSTNLRLTVPGVDRTANLSPTELTHLVQSGLPQEEVQQIVERMAIKRNPAIDLVKAALNLPAMDNENAAVMSMLPPELKEKALALFSEVTGKPATEAPPQFWIQAGEEMFGNRPLILGDKERGYQRYPSFASIRHFANLGLEGTDMSAVTASTLKSLQAEGDDLGLNATLRGEYKGRLMRAATNVSTMRNLVGTALEDSQTGVVLNSPGVPMNTAVGLASRWTRNIRARLHRWPHTSNEMYKAVFDFLTPADAGRRFPWLRRFTDPATRGIGSGPTFMMHGGVAAALFQGDSDADTMAIIRTMAKRATSPTELTRMAMKATGFSEERIGSLMDQGLGRAWASIFSRSMGLKGILKPGDWREQFDRSITPMASKLLGKWKRAQLPEILYSEERTATGKQLVGSTDVTVEAAMRFLDRYANREAAASGVAQATIGAVKTDVIDAAAGANIQEQQQRYGFAKRWYWGDIFRRGQSTTLAQRILAWPGAFQAAGFPAENLYPLYTTRSMDKEQLARMRSEFATVGEKGFLESSNIYRALTGRTMPEVGSPGYQEAMDLVTSHLSQTPIGRMAEIQRFGNSLSTVTDPARLKEAARMMRTTEEDLRQRFIDYGRANPDLVREYREQSAIERIGSRFPFELPAGARNRTHLEGILRKVAPLLQGDNPIANALAGPLSFLNRFAEPGQSPRYDEGDFETWRRMRQATVGQMDVQVAEWRAQVEAAKEAGMQPPKAPWIPSNFKLNPSLFSSGFRSELETATRIVTPYKSQQAYMLEHTPWALEGTQRGTSMHNAMEKYVKGLNRPGDVSELAIDTPLEGFWLSGRIDYYNRHSGEVVDYKFYSGSSMAKIAADPKLVSNLTGQIGAYLMALESQGKKATAGTFQFYNADIIEQRAAIAMGKGWTGKQLKANRDEIARWIEDNPQWLAETTQAMRQEASQMQDPKEAAKLYNEVRVELNDQTRSHVRNLIQQYEKMAYLVDPLAYSKPAVTQQETLKDIDIRKLKEENPREFAKHYERYMATQRKLGALLGQTTMPGDKEQEILLQMLNRSQEDINSPYETGRQDIDPQVRDAALAVERQLQERGVNARTAVTPASQGGRAAWRSRRRTERGPITDPRRLLEQKGIVTDPSRLLEAAERPVEAIEARRGTQGSSPGVAARTAASTGSRDYTVTGAVRAEAYRPTPLRGGGVGGGGGGSKPPTTGGSGTMPPDEGDGGGEGARYTVPPGSIGWRSDSNKVVLGRDISKQDLQEMMQRTREVMPAIARMRQEVQAAYESGDYTRAQELADQLSSRSGKLLGGLPKVSGIEFAGEVGMAAELSQVRGQVQASQMVAKNIQGALSTMDLRGDGAEKFVENLNKGAEVLERFQQPVKALDEALRKTNPNIRALGEMAKKIDTHFKPLIEALESKDVRAEAMRTEEGRRLYEQVLSGLKGGASLAEQAKGRREAAEIQDIMVGLSAGGGGRKGISGGRFQPLDSFGEFMGLGWLGWAAFSKQRIGSIFQSGIQEDIQTFYGAQTSGAGLARALGMPDYGGSEFQDRLVRNYFQSLTQAGAGRNLERIGDMGTRFMQERLSMDQAVGLETGIQGTKSVAGGFLDQALNLYIASKLIKQGSGALGKLFGGAGNILGGFGLGGRVAAATDVGATGLAEYLGVGTAATEVGGGGLAGIGALPLLGGAALLAATGGAGYLAYSQARQMVDPSFQNRGTDFMSSTYRMVFGERSPDDFASGRFGRIYLPMRGGGTQETVYAGSGDVFYGGRSRYGELIQGLTAEEISNLSKALLRGKAGTSAAQGTLSFSGTQELATFFAGATGGDVGQVQDSLRYITDQFGFTMGDFSSPQGLSSQLAYRLLTTASREAVDPRQFANEMAQFTQAISDAPLYSQTARQVALQSANWPSLSRQQALTGAQFMQAIGPRYRIEGPARLQAAATMGIQMGQYSSFEQGMIANLLNPQDQWSYSLAANEGLIQGSPLVDFQTGESVWAPQQRALNWAQFRLNRSYGLWQSDFRRRQAMIGFQRQRVDLGFAMRGAQMNYDYSVASIQRNMANIQEGLGMTLAERGLSREIMTTQWRFQDQERDIQRQRELVQRGWWREDFAFGRQRRGLVFSWQQEDLDRNIRLATGRQKRELIRQRDRQATLHGMDEGQKDKELERRKQQDKWRDDDFKRRKKQTETLRSLQLRLFDMQTGHIKRRAAMQMEAAQAQLKHIEEQRALELEQFEERKKRIEEDQEMFLEQWEKERAHLEAMNALQEAQLTLQEAQAKAVGDYNKFLNYQVTHLMPRYVGVTRVLRDLLNEIATAAKEARKGNGNDSPLPPPPDVNFGEYSSIFAHVKELIEKAKRMQEGL